MLNTPPRRVPPPLNLPLSPPRDDLPYISVSPVAPLAMPAEVSYYTPPRPYQTQNFQTPLSHTIIPPRPLELPTVSDDYLDEDENALSRAIAESLRVNHNRWTANGTNLEELAKAIANSKIETRGVYYQLE